MYDLFNNYLSLIQYNKIRKYWKIINKLNYKLKNYDYLTLVFTEYTDDEYEERIKSYLNNTRELNDYELLRKKIEYFEEEYIKYIKNIGYELLDRYQDEVLFQLLNNGIVLYD